MKSKYFRTSNELIARIASAEYHTLDPVEQNSCLFVETLIARRDFMYDGFVEEVESLVENLGLSVDDGHVVDGVCTYYCITPDGVSANIQDALSVDDMRDELIENGWDQTTISATPDPVVEHMWNLIPRGGSDEDEPYIGYLVVSEQPVETNDFPVFMRISKGQDTNELVTRLQDELTNLRNRRLDVTV